MTTSIVKLALWQVTATMHPDADAAAWVAQFPDLPRRFGFAVVEKEYSKDHRVSILAPADYKDMLRKLREVTDNPDLFAPDGAFAVQMSVPAFTAQDAEDQARPTLETLARKALAMIVAFDAQPAQRLGKATTALIRDLSAARVERGGEREEERAAHGEFGDPELESVIVEEGERVRALTEDMRVLTAKYDSGVSAFEDMDSAPAHEREGGSR